MNDDSAVQRIDAAEQASGELTLPARAETNRTEVQGLPRNLLSTLWGTGLMLLALGILYELYAWGGDERAMWVGVSLMVLVPVLVVVAHVLRVRQSGKPVASLCFFVQLLLDTLVLPFLFYIPALWIRLLGPFMVFAYGLSLMWYGAYYDTVMCLLAACVLVLAAVVSLPFCYGLAPALGGVVIFSGGLVIIIFAYRLKKTREKRIAAYEQARTRQQFNREQGEG